MKTIKKHQKSVMLWAVAQFGVVFSSVLKSDPALVVIYILMAGLSGPSD